VYSVGDDLPAEDIGLKPGMIITTINGSATDDIDDFFLVMNNTAANQTVNITFVSGPTTYTKTVQLADKYQILLERYQIQNTSLIEHYQGKGYLGVGTTTQFREDLRYLRNPFSNFPMGFIQYVGIPIIGFLQGYSALNEPVSDFYLVQSFLPEPIFWGLINILYWIFWINFMVATFNVLPMIPLDGGYMFRDTVDSFLRKIAKNFSSEARERIVREITTGVSFLILVLILSPLWVPFLRGIV
jgi:membrane-associated protease RseP (regulator of RpoE activity)